MIIEIFTTLSKALYSNHVAAMAAAFTWGILSIILSPCHLASIPLIVGFINDRGKMTTKKSFFLSLLFSAGILITIGFIGIITGMMGRMLGNIGGFANYFVAGILIIIGLHLVGLVPLPFFGGIDQEKIGRDNGYLAALMIGLIFGLAMGPCTFAYMAPVLAVVFSLSAKEFWYGLLLLLAYALGHFSVVVFAGTFTEKVQSYLNWNETSAGACWIRKICGILVIITGIYLMWGGE